MSFQIHDFIDVRSSDLSSSYALHFAARKGDLEEIQYLIEVKKMDVNQEDTRSTRPLHIAALFGQNEAVKLLLRYGAEVEDEAYFGQTALDLAVYKKHYDVARTLVLQGKANPNHVTWEENTPFSEAVTHLGEKLEIFPRIRSQNLFLNEIDEIIQTLAVFCDYSLSNHIYFNFASPPDYENSYYPMSLLLKWLSSQAPNEYYRVQIGSLIEKIISHDPTETYFTHAKNLLHVFPTGKEYLLTIDPQHHFSLMADGHSSLATTELAKDSLLSYKDYLAAQTIQDPLKRTLFEKLTAIYSTSLDLHSKAGDLKTAQKAFTLYHSGETLLLPTGWEGHFIDVILSKKHGYYVIANSGDRYPYDPSGSIFYHIQNQNKIDLLFFQDILVNKDQTKLEYENMYKYELAEKVYLIEAPDQKFGNCGWASHLNAIEALLYIELLNNDIAPKEAVTLSHTYYEEWKEFHGFYVIDQYLSDEPPGLPVEAFIDIIEGLHTEKEINEHDKHHAEKITSIITSPLYETSFKEWLENDGSDHLETLTPLLESYGIALADWLPHSLAPEPEQLALQSDVEPDIQSDVEALLTPSLLNQLPDMPIDFVSAWG